MPDRSKTSYLADFTERWGQLMIGTDSWLQGYAYHDELELFERAGFSAAEVLRLATRAGPEYLGRGRIQGTVEASGGG